MLQLGTRAAPLGLCGHQLARSARVHMHHLPRGRRLQCGLAFEVIMAASHFCGVSSGAVSGVDGFLPVPTTLRRHGTMGHNADRIIVVAEPPLLCRVSIRANGSMHIHTRLPEELESA
jgi:hypothetical protein